MNLQVYIENVQRQLAAAAGTGGDDARALAELLLDPLDAAIRLALQDALTAAMEEITCELAPGSVELRLRGRELEFVVTPPVEETIAEAPEGGVGALSDRPRVMAAGAAPPVSDGGDEGGMSRINLRLPEQLKTRIEQAAGREVLSINAWLVRAAVAALNRSDPGPPQDRRAAKGAQRYTGWAR